MLIGGHVVGFFLVKELVSNLTWETSSIGQGGTCQATSGVSLGSILLVLSFQLMNLIPPNLYKHFLKTLKVCTFTK